MTFFLSVCVVYVPPYAKSISFIKNSVFYSAHFCFVHPGTATSNLGFSVKEYKRGQSYKCTKAGVSNFPIGKVRLNPVCYSCS